MIGCWQLMLMNDAVWNRIVHFSLNKMLNIVLHLREVEYSPLLTDTGVSNQLKNTKNKNKNKQQKQQQHDSNPVTNSEYCM